MDHSRTPDRPQPFVIPPQATLIVAPELPEELILMSGEGNLTLAELTRDGQSRVHVLQSLAAAVELGTLQVMGDRIIAAHNLMKIPV